MMWSMTARAVVPIFIVETAGVYFYETTLSSLTYISINKESRSVIMQILAIQVHFKLLFRGGNLVLLRLISDASFFYHLIVCTIWLSMMLVSGYWLLLLV